MKIVTVNINEAYLNAIDKLTGNDGLYPSRSELVRVATRAFLIKELNMANQLSSYQKKPIEEKPFDHENYVRVPVDDDFGVADDGNFKTFKIVKK